MSGSASLDADDAGWYLRKEFQHLLASQLSPYHYIAAVINRMNLKHRLRYIDANSRDLFHLNAPGLSILTDAILAPAEREPSIPSVLHCSCSDPIKTNMTPIRGRSRKGQRLQADAPFGKWNTQTFIAGLRCDAITAPFVVDGTMDGEKFDIYVRTQLAPTLTPGDVVIWDNLNVHKSPRAAAAIAEKGAWILFLPQYLPDKNPIEMAFSKLKSLLRKAKARTYDDLWKAVGKVCGLFSPQECWNYFKAAGCVAH
ncbi:MAG TPA: hypothetical protein DFK19_08425 [Ochrobactrum sp.]|nr:hypothetical protein [Ochrobactrum sp.]